MNNQSTIVAEHYGTLTPLVVNAVRAEAEHAAELLALMFKESGFEPRKTESSRCPNPAAQIQAQEKFTQISAALRIREWEDRGFFGFVSGLVPDSTKAFSAVLAERNGEKVVGIEPRELPARVLGAFLKRFAWTGRLYLGCDVALTGQCDRTGIVAEVSGLAVRAAAREREEDGERS